MRCTNCGWDNPNGLTKCEKCGTPLTSVGGEQRFAVGGTAREDSSSAYAGTAMEAGNGTPAFGKTVREASVFGEAAVLASSSSPKNDGRCPECGYPLRPGVSVCPKCHHMIGGTEREPDLLHPASVSKPSFPDEPKKETNFGGTVMPGMNISPDIWFSLTPLAIAGERETPAKVEFEGKHHELNRENLDPKNHTITSKVQAMMDYDTEKKLWYIQDKSALQYTFLYCCGEVPVVDGDVLLMGDRKFIFHADETPVAAEPQNFTGTIAVGRQRVNAPRCTLVPVVDEGEMDAPKEQMFRGDAHQLNRANLDPENHTITSKVQAELTCENGQWFIKDCSQMQTTYILCQDPMDLKNGDRILMGNRLFTFNC